VWLTSDGPVSTATLALTVAPGGFTFPTFNNWAGILAPTAASATQPLTFTAAQTSGANAQLTPPDVKVAYAGTIQIGTGSASTLTLGASISVVAAQTLTISAGTGGSTIFALSTFSVSITGATTAVTLGTANQVTVTTGGGTFSPSTSGILNLANCNIQSGAIGTFSGGVLSTYLTLCGRQACMCCHASIHFDRDQ